MAGHDRYAALALAATLLAAAPARAVAYPVSGPPATGLSCDSLRVPAEDGGEPGAVWGGPLVAGDDGATISTRCSIQLGRRNDRHSGADTVSVESAAGTGRAVIPPARASPRGDRAYLCTEVTVAGVTYDWDGGLGGGRSTSGDAACDVATAPVRHVREIRDAACSVDRCVPPWGFDALVRPIVASLSPGVPGVADLDREGDVTVLDRWLYDCPPYGV